MYKYDTDQGGCARCRGGCARYRGGCARCTDGDVLLRWPKRDNQGAPWTSVLRCLPVYSSLLQAGEGRNSAWITDSLSTDPQFPCFHLYVNASLILEPRA